MDLEKKSIEFAQAVISEGKVVEELRNEESATGFIASIYKAGYKAAHTGISLQDSLDDWEMSEYKRLRFEIGLLQQELAEHERLLQARAIRWWSDFKVELTSRRMSLERVLWELKLLIFGERKISSSLQKQIEKSLNKYWSGE